MTISRGILWAGFILFLLIMGYYVDAFRYYHADGLFALQTETSTTDAKSILFHWSITQTSKGNLISFARIITWYDLAFILFYTGLVIMLSNRAQREPRLWLNTLLRLNIFLIVIVALLDFTENFFFFYNLRHWETNFINIWWITWLKYIIGTWVFIVLLFSLLKRTLVAIIVLIVLCVLIWLLRQTRSEKSRVDAFMHHYFDSIRDNDAALTGFFSEMPKGGDLHHHYSGSIYAETFLQMAIDKKLWLHVDSLKLKQALTPKEKKDPKYVQMDVLAKQRGFGDIKQRLFQEWSVKDFYEGYRASDKHFFDAFGKFPRYGWREMVDGLIELKQRAKKENVRYIETMLTSIDCDTMIKESKKYDSLLRMNAYADSTVIRSYLDAIRDEFIQKNNLFAYVKAFGDSLNRIHTQSAVDDSSFTMRYLTYSNRNNPPVRFFRDLLMAFEAANTHPLVAGVNILAPEDGDISMRDYRLHMYMFSYCHRLYDSVKYSMHAGELTMGLVKPEDLTFHIRDAVYIAGARRIGHGVDMAYEQDHTGLLDHMKEKNVAVEINLVSNEFILKVKGDSHPITLYKKHGVPIVISTDDVGILRSNLLQQFVLLAQRYKEISYADIKTFIYNSIQYSFIKEPALKEKMLNDIKASIDLFEKKIMNQ